MIFPGLVYWMLARFEEIGVDEKYLDKHLRFCSSSSHSAIYKYNEHPIIDYWQSITYFNICQLFF